MQPPLSSRFVRAALGVAIAFLTLSCGTDRETTAPAGPPTLKVHVDASAEGARMMVRTPSAPRGERGGTTLQLEATVANPNGHVLPHKRDIDWSSSDTLVATVDSSGLVTAQDTGAVSIIVDHKYAADTVAIRVIPVPVASVAVTGPDSVSLDDTASYAATTLDSVGVPLVGRAISWGTGDASVAQISQAGVLVAIATGETSVEATSEGKTGSVHLKVWPQPVASVTVAPADTTIGVYSTATLRATARDRRGKLLTDRPFAWSSLDASIAGVSPAGVVTPVSLGGVGIVATAEGKSDTAHVTVAPPVEARALWVTRFEYTAPGEGATKIATIFRNAARAHFNVVYFQVRTAGDALYAPRSPNPLEPCSPRLCGTLGGPLPYDPLAVALQEAAKYGIEVHAWLNSNTAWIAGSTTACNQLISTSVPKHMAIEHPDWLMVDINGVKQPCATTSEYIWFSPGWAGVRSRLAAVAADLARRYGPGPDGTGKYGLRGIHLDRIRYPGRTWSYDTASVNAYKRVYGVAPTANAASWANFRRSFVNAEVKEVADSVRAIDATMVISAAVWPIHKNMPGWPVFSSGYDDYFQDPPTWAAGGYLDVAAPMTYPATATSVSYLIKPTECASLDWVCLYKYHRTQIEQNAGRQVYIGVTAIRGAPDMTAEIAKARELHAYGMSVYSYSLVDAFDGWSVLANGLFKFPATIPARPWMPMRD